MQRASKDFVGSRVWNEASSLTGFVIERLSIPYYRHYYLAATRAPANASTALCKPASPTKGFNLPIEPFSEGGIA